FPTELSRVYLAWHIPGVTHADLPALDVLAAVLGQGRSSRLYTELRDRRQLAFDVGAHAYTPSGPGLFLISGITAPDKREAFTNAVLELVAQVAVDGISDQELARARRMLLTDQLSNLTTMRGKASALGSNWLLTGNLEFTGEYLRRLQDVTLEDLKRVSATYFHDDTLSIVSLNPEAFAGQPEASTENLTENPIHRFELDNGLRLLVREDPRLPLVSIHCIFRSGVLAEPAEQNGISALLASLLPKGTTSRSAEELSLLIEEAGGSLEVSSGNNSLSVAINLLGPDFELGIEVLADLVLNASLPGEAFERERDAQLALIKEQNDDPLFVARRGFAKAMFGDHPYSRQPAGTPETVSSLTREKLLAFRDQHLTAKNGVLAVFGAVKAEEVRRVVETHLAGLPSGTLAFEKPPQPKWPGKEQSVKNELPKNQAILVIGYPGRAVSDRETVALHLIASASNSMGSRFFDRIREQLGLAYFVGAANQSGPAAGSLFFYLGTDPAKLDQVRAEFEFEILRLRDQGLTAEELDRAKNKELAAIKLERQQNASFAQQAALDELLGLGYRWEDHLIDAFTRISLDEVNAVAKEVLSSPSKVISIVQPSSNSNTPLQKAAVTP
ncbi:MAG: insulinase family protein, partial [Verrucomicrobiia bacterium]